jgi:hypothetical protein
MYFNITEQIILPISLKVRVGHVAADSKLKIYFSIITDTVSGSELTWRMIALLMNKELERILRKDDAPKFDVLYRILGSYDHET